MNESETPACKQYSTWHRIGGYLGPCIKDEGHPGWHLDASGASWAPKEKEPEESK